MEACVLFKAFDLEMKPCLSLVIGVDLVPVVGRLDVAKGGEYNGILAKFFQNLPRGHGCKKEFFVEFSQIDIAPL